MITIYHNTRCSKSRSALQILEAQGMPYKVRLYMQEPLGRKELEVLLRQLGMQPTGLLRKRESIYKELVAKTNSEEDWLEHMLQHPQLIERPIVTTPTKAIIARPPERVLDVL